MSAPMPAGRGTLRVYLGAAPGVGKTYAMLGEAHRRLERGTDVVVGVVETYGRARTAALVEGLEVLPRRVVAYRGARLEELDVAAVLARRPQVVVVDELAHSNVPGSGNGKRWQDVEVLLAAGIEVLTTVNVQHLESLNDVVQTINAVADEWPALWRRDNEPGGFQWLDADDADHSMYAFARWDTAGAAAVICIANFTPLSRPGYRVGLPWGGAWRVVLDTDNAAFWGSGLRGLEDDVVTAADPAVPWQSLETSGQLDIGPMSMVWLASTAPPPPSTS